jgi:hypothetical protein
MPFVLLWLRAFALTLGVELLLAARLLRGEGRKLDRRLGAALVANLASHPAVWFVFPELGLGGAGLAMSELWAFASEALVYRLVFPALSWRRAVVISAAANGASFLIGLALRRVAGWP